MQNNKNSMFGTIISVAMRVWIINEFINSNISNAIWRWSILR